VNDTPLITIEAVPGPWLPITQSWLFDQVRFLPAPVEAHVVCTRLENAEHFPFPRVYPADDAPRGPRAVDRLLRRLRLRRHRGAVLEAARDLGAEVLHSHFGPEGWRNGAVADRLGLHHVVSFYGYDVDHLPRSRPRWRRRYRDLFARVDLVLCEGPRMAERIADLGCPEARLCVHRLGIDLSTITFRPRAWDGREPLRVLLAAAFREKKGLPDAIDALAEVHRDVPIDITIIGNAVGAPESRAEKARILAAIERGRLGSRTSLLGFQPHAVLLEQAYRHHLYLAPSITAANGDTEGGAPVGLIEMAASGMPVVSTHHCDIPGVIVHEETGFLARERDARDLAGQVRRMLEHRAAWPEMLERGRRRIEERFCAAGQGERLASIYRRLARGWRYHAAVPEREDGAERESA